jgi:Protein of unknown function (DUF3137)
MQSLSQFRLFYNHTIHPELVRMEQKRKQLVWLFVVSVLLFVAVFGLNIYIKAFSIALVLMIPLGLWASYLLYRIQKFRVTFKPHVVDLILDFIDDDPNFGTLTYDSKKKIERSEFVKSGLFVNRMLEYNGEDYIKGKVGELDFELCELEVKALSRVSTELEVIFRGVFLRAKFNTVTNGAVIVWPRAKKQYHTKAVKQFVHRGGKNVDDKNEVESFRELFTAYATSDAHVDKTLNREIQIALADYHIQTDKTLYFSFIDDNIYIAISESKDILEPNILDSNAHFDLVREFYEDLQMLFNIVERIDAVN